MVTKFKNQLAKSNLAKNTVSSYVDGDKQNGIERTNLDVKYLRGERDAKTLTSGKYVTANSLLILVDGENSGEVFRTINLRFRKEIC